jgi:nickel transport protein
MLCMRPVRKILLFSLLLFFLSSAIGFAHKVNIFAWVEGDTIHTESYFPDGTMVKSGKIEVIDSTGTVVNQGTTDENGEYSFRIPKYDNLTIVLDASMGHRATFKISVDELQTAPRESERENEEKTESRYEIKSSKDEEVESFTNDEVRKIVSEELSRQLKPIIRDIAELRAKRRISTQDIFAGIGYVLGLMGIAMYFRSKGKK